jgi:hypothetical protein
MVWHDFFSDIFVLSLLHKVERRRKLTAELERVGIHSSDVKWISAMDGSKPEIRTLVERFHIIEQEYLSFFTNGHLGCLFSHYSLWMSLFTKHINESLEERWYLILEDDTEFIQCVSPSFLKELWASKPTDAKLIKFHTTYGYEENPDLISTDSGPYFRKQTKISFSLMCYAIHSSLLSTLLFTKWKNHIDLFHTEGIYIVKTPQGVQHAPQTLYNTNGIFTEGICKTNYETDSDTITSSITKNLIEPQSVQQLYASLPPKEGTYSVPIYDKFQKTGTCHVHFQVELKNYHDSK